jgi:hypothetical protein
MYRNIILPAFYEWETWSLTLREERKLRVFGNRVLRRIFGSKRDDIIGEGRKLHTEELNDLYLSPSVFRVINKRMIWSGHVTCIGLRRGVYRVFGGET